MKNREIKYNNIPIPNSKQNVECLCGWSGPKGELWFNKDIELRCSLNKNNPNCNLQHLENCHQTEFLLCPKCERVIFADGRKI